MTVGVLHEKHKKVGDMTTEKTPQFTTWIKYVATSDPAAQTVRARKGLWLACCRGVKNFFFFFFLAPDSRENDLASI